MKPCVVLWHSKFEGRSCRLYILPCSVPQRQWDRALLLHACFKFGSRSDCFFEVHSWSTEFEKDSRQPYVLCGLSFLLDALHMNAVHEAYLIATRIYCTPYQYIPIDKACWRAEWQQIVVFQMSKRLNHDFPLFVSVVASTECNSLEDSLSSNAEAWPRLLGQRRVLPKLISITLKCAFKGRFCPVLVILTPTLSTWRKRNGTSETHFWMLMISVLDLKTTVGPIDRAIL